MSERRWGNFSSCCRLCLTEKLGALKPIFDDAAVGQDMMVNIQECVNVEIKADDKLSTMICETCTNQVKSWKSFRHLCMKNQSKLETWMNDWNSNSANDALDVSIRIKDEVMDDNEGEEGATTTNNGAADDDVRIKTEPIDPIDAIYHVETELHSDGYDYPPSLSPPAEIANQKNGPVSVEEEAEEEVISDGKSCITCNKSFSSVANRHRHDAVFHRGNKRKADAAKASTPNKKPATITNGEIELQKIQFAAGLQLKQRSENSEPVLLEDMALTKVELSYLERCKILIKMTDTLTCVCHNETYEQIRDLHIHLKKQRQWFAMFTCYNCMITYTERSAYMKHFCCCKKDVLQNLRRLVESPVNPEIKIRLYQNYKCLRCNCIFGFYEDFCSHFDVDHMELLQNAPPYVCFCSKSFDEMDDYRQHLHIACFLRYFCDVCFEVFPSVEEFRSHCEEEHDHSEPGLLQPYDPFSKPKSRSGTPSFQPRRSLQTEIGKRDKNDDLRHLTRRRTLNLPSSENSSQVSEATPDLDEEDPDYSPEQPKVLQNLPTLKSSNPATCPDCGKTYSTYHNMLRHYKLSHDEAGRILECRFCDEKFRLITELKDHEANEHGEEDDIKTELSFDASSRPFNFSCPDCGALFSNTEDWAKHMETHPKRVCEECDKEFASQSELDNHRSVHLNLKVYRDSETKGYKSAIVSPSLICETCDKSFANKSELRHHKLLHEKMPVLSAQDGSLIEEKVDLSKKFSCIPCDKHYVSYGGIWDHNKKHHPNQQITSEYPKKCGLCEKVISSRGAWSNHEKMHERLANMKRDVEEEGEESRSSKQQSAPDSNDDDESYHTCKRCFKVFSSKYNLKNHMKCHGINLNTSRSSTKTGKIIKTYWCNICHQACPGYAELQEHKREHVSENRTTIKQEEDSDDGKQVFECDECSLTFPSNMALARHQEKHIKRVETTQKLVSVYCKYCKVPFPSVSDLNDHMDKDHSDMTSKPKVQQAGTKHICKLCKKVFDNPGALASHQGWHKRVKFNRVRAQEQLVKAMAAKKSKPSSSYQFQCSNCPARFPTDSTLQIHILETHRNINTTVLIMKCNSCKMSFDKKSAFDIHMQLHKQVESKSTKAFSCKYCPAGFSRADTLNLHIKQNHREFLSDKFKCVHCDRNFEKQNALTVHLKTHDRQKLTGETNSPKPSHNKSIYFCSICDLGFALAKDLRNHVLSAHPF